MVKTLHGKLMIEQHEPNEKNDHNRETVVSVWIYKGQWQK
jgi:hypothetical protein